MVNPAIDSLQEIKITTNSYDAEFGQVAGAVFQASTKSGTNAYHGSLFASKRWRRTYVRGTRRIAPGRSRGLLHGRR